MHLSEQQTIIRTSVAENFGAGALVRNKLAHEYLDYYASNAGLINLASFAATDMHQLLLTIQASFGREHPSLALGMRLDNRNILHK